MFIQTEPTANSDVMKFLPGRAVLDAGFVEYVSAEEAGRSPLAQTLFEIEGVSRVGLDNEAVTVGKAPDRNWQTLKPLILGAIMEQFTSGKPVVADAGDGDDETAASDADPALVAQVTELINTRIKPVAQQDGGDVDFHSIQGGTVYLKLEGSAFGLMNGIHNMLRHYVPEVADVRDYRDILPKPGLMTDTGRALKELFDTQINPAVAAHGGHITLLDVTDDAVFIRMEGGCQGCGMSQVTLKQGVETEIRRIAPEIREIYDTTQHAEGKNPYYQGGMAGM